MAPLTVPPAKAAPRQRQRLTGRIFAETRGVMAWRMGRGHLKAICLRDARQASRAACRVFVRTAVACAQVRCTITHSNYCGITGIRVCWYMKATIEIPDDLYRRVKARSAILGRSVREVTTELYQRWLGELPPENGHDVHAWIDDWVSLGAELTPATDGEKTARQMLDDDRNRLEAGRQE